MSKPFTHLTMEYSKILRRVNSHPKEAVKYIRQVVSRHKKACVSCGVVEEYTVHSIDHQGVRTFQCQCCRKTWSELYGTIFYRSKIPLWKWCVALLEECISTGACSGAALARRIEVSHQSSWKMLTKIREGLLPTLNTTFLEGDVEGDEAWCGKKDNQDIVCGFVSRTQRAIVFCLIPNVKEETLYPLVKHYVKKKSTFYTDQRISYAATNVYYQHYTVNHSKKEFARDHHIHTNTIEHIWGDFKGIVRTIHHGISKRHRRSYLALYAFKYQHKHSSNLFYHLLSILFQPTYCLI